MAVRKTKTEQPAGGAPDELFLIGRFYRPHGVRGEVKVIPETDDPARFQALKTVYVGSDAAGEAVPISVESVRAQSTKHGLTVLLKLAGVDSIAEAEALREQLVFAKESDLPPLDEDEFYLHDLVGLNVLTEAGEAVGKVRDVLDLPAHYVCVVARPGQPDALIPGVPEFILEVDLEARRLVVRPIEGLLE